MIINDLKPKYHLKFKNQAKESWSYTLLIKNILIEQSREIEVVTNDLDLAIDDIKNRVGNNFTVTDVSDTEPVQIVKRERKFKIFGSPQ